MNIFHLTENMRITQTTGDEDKVGFAGFLLDLCEGKIPVIPEQGDFAIEINESLPLPSKRLEDIVSWVYTDIQTNIANPKWLCEYAQPTL